MCVCVGGGGGGGGQGGRGPELGQFSFEVLFSTVLVHLLIILLLSPRFLLLTQSPAL